MPLYEYKAIDSKGQEVAGRVDAASLEIALDILKEEELQTVEIRDASQQSYSSPSSTPFLIPIIVLVSIGLILLLTAAGLYAVLF